MDIFKYLLSRNKKNRNLTFIAKEVAKQKDGIAKLLRPKLFYSSWKSITEDVFEDKRFDTFIDSIEKDVDQLQLKLISWSMRTLNILRKSDDQDEQLELFSLFRQFNDIGIDPIKHARILINSNIFKIDKLESMEELEEEVRKAHRFFYNAADAFIEAIYLKY